jgi:hypothetical protein
VEVSGFTALRNLVADRRWLGLFSRSFFISSVNRSDYAQYCRYCCSGPKSLRMRSFDSEPYTKRPCSSMIPGPSRNTSRRCRTPISSSSNRYHPKVRNHQVLGCSKSKLASTPAATALAHIRKYSERLVRGLRILCWSRWVEKRGDSREAAYRRQF